MSETTLLILAALVAVLLIVWILRSRKNPNHHIDTSVTAVGAVTEAVRDLADDVSKAVTHTEKAEIAPSSAKADASAVAPSEAAAIMASAGAGAAADAPSATAASIGTGADNLRLLKGVGPKLAALLTQLGITRFDQIATWNEADVTLIDSQLGNFKGRIVRDNWIEQARFLASGDVAGFEAKFGKLDSPSNI